MKGLEKNISEEYEAKFGVEMANDANILDDLSFKDLADELNKGETGEGKDYEDIYEFLGIGDSMVREEIFGMLSKILSVSYDVIYKKWLAYTRLA